MIRESRRNKRRTKLNQSSFRRFKLLPFGDSLESQERSKCFVSALRGNQQQNNLRGPAGQLFTCLRFASHAPAAAASTAAAIDHVALAERAACVGFVSADLARCAPAAELRAAWFDESAPPALRRRESLGLLEPGPLQQSAVAENEPSCAAERLDAAWRQRAEWSATECLSPWDETTTSTHAAVS